MVNKNKTFHKAFSLAEILIVLVIIGVIVVLMLNIIKPSKFVTKMQYMKAYNMLTVAAYNVYDDALNDNKTILYTSTSDLCTHLTNYINTTYKNCNASAIAYTGASFPDSSRKFMASNDMIFYISNPLTIGEMTHRIVWVDINGKRKPNTATWKFGNPADIVAFDINDQGEVVPLGYPKIDRHYMQAKVVYASDEENEKSYPMTYLEAQTMAFGGKSFDYDMMSYNFDQTNGSFANSVLRIETKRAQKYTKTITSGCENETDAEFPRCTVEITN